MQGLQAPLTQAILSVYKDDGDDVLRSPYSRRPRKSPSQLLDIEPPTYSRTLSEGMANYQDYERTIANDLFSDLARAFEAVEASALSSETEQQPQHLQGRDIEQPNGPEISASLVPNDANDGLDLPIPVVFERHPSVDYRRRRRDVFLQHDET